MLTTGFAGAVVDLTRQLVAFDSVNPGLVPGAMGEGPIAQFVADRLSGSGFEVRLVPAVSDPRRMSVIAVRDGGRPGRTVVLNGHLDTVGVDGMAEPFTARIDGDRMFGRGTSDMKGGVAGLVIAAEQLVAAGAWRGSAGCGSHGLARGIAQVPMDGILLPVHNGAECEHWHRSTGAGVVRV